MSKKSNHKQIIAQNKQARYEYELLEFFEAGIILTGSEVKSLRVGKANITDAFAHIEGDEIFLNNAYIATYSKANRQNHPERRPRKLLLHKTEIQKLIGKIKVKGMTVVPTQMYFNNKNIVKIEVALAKGKKTHDKRQTEKDRDWNRQKQRLLKNSD